MTDSTQDDTQPDSHADEAAGQLENDQPETTADQDALADDWAAALAEQEQADISTQAEGLKDEADSQTPETTPAEDDWAAALAEQTAAEAVASQQKAESSSAIEARPAGPDLFRPLSGDGSDGQSEIDLIRDIPVQMSVELGRTRLTIQNLLQLGQGSVVELDGLAGEPMDIYVNGYLIAQGEVVVVDDKYGIRITDIITPSDRIQRLHSSR